MDNIINIVRMDNIIEREKESDHEWHRERERERELSIGVSNLRFWMFRPSSAACQIFSCV